MSELASDDAYSETRDVLRNTIPSYVERALRVSRALVHRTLFETSGSVDLRARFGVSKGYSRDIGDMRFRWADPIACSPVSSYQYRLNVPLSESGAMLTVNYHANNKRCGLWLHRPVPSANPKLTADEDPRNLMSYPFLFYAVPVDNRMYDASSAADESGPPETVRISLLPQAGNRSIVPGMVRDAVDVDVAHFAEALPVLTPADAVKLAQVGPYAFQMGKIDHVLRVADLALSLR